MNLSHVGSQKASKQGAHPGNSQYQLSCPDRMAEPISEIPQSVYEQNEISSCGFINELKYQVLVMVADVPDVICF